MSSFTNNTTTTIMPTTSSNAITENFSCGHSRLRHDLASGPHALTQTSSLPNTTATATSIYFGTPAVLSATGRTVTTATISALPQLYTNGPCPLPACQSHDFHGLNDVVVQPAYSANDAELVKKYYGLYFEGEETWWAIKARVERLHAVTRRTVEGLYLPELAAFVTTWDGETEFRTMAGEPVRVGCTMEGYHFDEVQAVLARMDDAVDNRAPRVTFISNAIRAKACLREMFTKLRLFDELATKLELIQRSLRKADLLWEPEMDTSVLEPEEVTPEFLAIAGMNVDREKVAMAILMPGVTDWSHVAVPELNVNTGVANACQSLPVENGHGGPWTATVDHLFAASRVSRRAGLSSVHISPTDVRPWRMGGSGVQVGDESGVGGYAADDEASSGSEELGYRKEAAHATAARDFDYLEY